MELLRRKTQTSAQVVTPRLWAFTRARFLFAVKEKETILKNQQVSTTPTGFKYLKLYFNKGSASQTCEACASSSLLGLSTASNGLCSMTVCIRGAKVKFHEGNLNQNTCKHYHHALLHHFQQNKQISIHQLIINNYFTKAWLYKYSKLSNSSEWQVIQTLHYTHTKKCN